MSNNMFGSVVKRGLPLSKNGREALGHDITIYLNAPLNPGEVRQMLNDRSAIEAQIAKLKGATPTAGADPVGEIGQLMTTLRQQNNSLAQFFSIVWLAPDGSQLPAEFVMGLHSIVGPGETKAMMTATLSAMEAYQGGDKAGAMGGQFSQPEPEGTPAASRPFELSDDTKRAWLAAEQARARRK